MTASKPGQQPVRLGVLMGRSPRDYRTVLVSNPTNRSRYPRDTVECRGAWVRAHLRSVALVLTLTGRLDAGNVDPLAEHLARFIRLGGPLVVDVDALHIADDAAFERLLALVDAECHLQDADWMLVADALGHECSAAVLDQVPFAASLPEALHHFVCAIRSRRTMSLSASPTR